MSDHTDGCSYQSCTCKPGPMTAERHAEAILDAILAAEAAGYTVSAVANEIWVADHYVLNEPVLEDGIWEVSE